MATATAPTKDGPDITRDGGGFKIGLTYLPDFWPPEARKDAAITIHTGDGKVLLDTILVPAEEAPEVYRHPVLRSKTYAEALT